MTGGTLLAALLVAWEIAELEHIEYQMERIADELHKQNRIADELHKQNRIAKDEQLHS